MHFWKQVGRRRKILTKYTEWIKKKKAWRIKENEIKSEKATALMVSPEAFLFPLERTAKVLLWKPNVYFHITKIMKLDTKQIKKNNHLITMLNTVRWFHQLVRLQDYFTCFFLMESPKFCEPIHSLLGSLGKG